MATEVTVPVLTAAAGGDLPAWARVTPRRREHIARVAALMNGWAEALGLSAAERARWRAAAWLHDALRDASEAELRAILDGECADLPTALLHGPAAARLLEGEGDAELADAVRYHTVGHPDFGMLGRALYLADFLDPGRGFERDWCDGLRARMPADFDAVLLEVVEARTRYLTGSGHEVRPETAAFLSSLRSPE